MPLPYTSIEKLTRIWASKQRPGVEWTILWQIPSYNSVISGQIIGLQMLWNKTKITKYLYLHIIYIVCLNRRTHLSSIIFYNWDPLYQKWYPFRYFIFACWVVICVLVVCRIYDQLQNCLKNTKLYHLCQKCLIQIIESTLYRPWSGPKLLTVVISSWGCFGC